VNHHVIVGSRDTAVEDALNMSEPVVARQGIGRRTRARRWVMAMSRLRAAQGLSPVRLTELQGLTHDFSLAHERHDLASLVAAAMGLLPAAGGWHG
jgi:hypothetical protein